MKVFNKKRGQKGFTLLELLIALFLLAFGLLAAASMQTTAINANMVSNRNTSITTVAKMVMEDLLSVDNQNIFWKQRLTTANIYQYDRFPPYEQQSNPVATLNYSIPGTGVYTATYQVFPNDPIPNVSRIRVQVVLNNNAALSPFWLVGYRHVEP